MIPPDTYEPDERIVGGNRKTEGIKIAVNTNNNLYLLIILVIKCLSMMLNDGRGILNQTWQESLKLTSIIITFFNKKYSKFRLYVWIIF